MPDLPNWLIALFLKPFVALVLMGGVVLPIRLAWRSLHRARRDRRDQALESRTE